MSVEIDDTALEALFHDPVGPVAQIMEHKAQAVQDAAKRLIEGPAGGRTYDIRFFRGANKAIHPGGKGPTEQASAPGQAPHTLTGHLVGSLGHSLEEGDQGIEGVIYDTALYARMLELGTSSFAPRPYLRPAMDIGTKE